MTSYEAISVMIQFGVYTLALLTLIIVIIKLSIKK